MDQSIQDFILFQGLKKVVKKSANYVFLKDLNLVYLYCSEEFSKITKAGSVEGVIGKTDFELFDYNIAKKYTDDNKKMLATGVDILSIVERIPSSNDQPKYCQTSKEIIRNQEGNPIAVYGICYVLNSVEVYDSLSENERKIFNEKSNNKDIFYAVKFELTKKNTFINLKNEPFDYDVEYDDKYIKMANELDPLNGFTNNEINRKVFLFILSHIIGEDSQKYFNENFNKVAISNQIISNIYQKEMECRMMINGENQFVSISYEIVPENETGLIYAYVYITNIRNSLIEKIIDNKIIGSNIDTIMYYDLKLHTMNVLRNNFYKMSNCYSVSYDDFLNDMINSAVKEDQYIMKDNLTLEAIEKNLKNKDFFSFVCEASSDNLKDGLKNKKLIFKNTVYYLDNIHDIIVFLLQDVTDIVEKERKEKNKLEYALKETKAANKSKSDLIQRVSHDIRTPMNVISAMTDFAFQDMKNEEKLRQDLLDIKTSSAFLLNLINDILDVSKIESGSMTLNPEYCSLSEYYFTIKNMFEPLANQKGITFHIDYDKTSLDGIIIDKIKHNQIVFNLISNAVKFTKKDGDVYFHFNASKIDSENGVLEFSIKDTGIGIIKDFQKVMFEPFTQENVYHSLLLSEKGTGLGLSIVKKMVDFMGGTIKCVSKINSGSTFYVSLSCGIPKMEEKETIKVRNDQSLKGNVLIAEDHPINAEIIMRLLASFGLSTTLTRNGKEALEAFTSSIPYTFDLILMDIQMPQMDGYQTTKAIRSLDRIDSKSIPIVAMTAFGMQDDINKAFNAGMTAYIIKPINPDNLVSTLEKYLKKP